MKTEFIQKEPGAQWYWRTTSDNGRIVADGSEGYNRLSGAINGFLNSQGKVSTDDDVELFHSQLIRSNENQSVTYQYTHQSNIEKGNN